MNFSHLVNHGLTLVNQAYFHGRFILCADEVNDYVTKIDPHFVPVYVLKRDYRPEFGGHEREPNKHGCPRPSRGHGHGHGVSTVSSELCHTVH